MAGGVSAVSATLTRTMEFVDNRHTPNHEDVLRDLQDTISRIGSQIFPLSSVALVLCPEHAQMFAAAGLSKADVQNWLLERCGRTGAELTSMGKAEVARPRRSAASTRATRRSTSSWPARPSIPVIVAGAKNAAISMVVRIFGEWSGTAVPVVEKKVDYTERMADIATMLAADGYNLASRRTARASR